MHVCICAQSADVIMCVCVHVSFMDVIHLMKQLPWAGSRGQSQGSLAWLVILIED